jgi:hypothetical protein
VPLNLETPRFSASTSFRGGKKGGGKSNIECYNCHKKGHMKANCWAKGGGKEGQGPKGKGKSQPKKEQAATAAADSDDAVWMAYDCRSADIVLDNCGDIFDDLFEDPDDDSESSDDANSPAEWIHNKAKGLLVEDNEGEAYTQYKTAILAHNCKGNLTILRRIFYLDLAKGNLKRML